MRRSTPNPHDGRRRASRCRHRTCISVTDRLGELSTLASQAGFRFLARLIDDWQRGVCRFVGKGEARLVARQAEQLIGIGGLTQDITAPQPGPVRRVFIRPTYRRQGIGRALLYTIEQHARLHFPQLVLRTDTREAALFYEHPGYSAVAAHPQRTHEKLLSVE